MKKLFLALVCFAGVAFFASCGGNETSKEPTVTIKTDKNVIEDGEEITFTIKANSNVNTKKELSSLHFILSYDTEKLWDTTLVSNGVTEIEKELTFALEFGYDDAVEIEAEVFAYDAADRYAVATTYFTVVPTEDELIEDDIVWYKDGSNDAVGLADYGLEWKNNLAKDIYAVVKPVAGAKLYQFATTSVYENVTTESEKIAAFENATEIQQWKEFNTAGAATQNVDYVLGTKYAGEYYLINITKGVIIPWSQTHQKTEVTLYGKVK